MPRVSCIPPKRQAPAQLIERKASPDLNLDLHDIAARIVAARFGLTLHVAQLLCHLAGVGQGAPR